jgi:hypothetical protein
MGKLKNPVCYCFAVLIQGDTRTLRLEPSREHYGCSINLLCRSRRPLGRGFQFRRDFAHLTRSSNLQNITRRFAGRMSCSWAEMVDEWLLIWTRTTKCKKLYDLNASFSLHEEMSHVRKERIHEGPCCPDASDPSLEADRFVDN